MTLPTISIVTISFNQARFLEAAIESVLGQGYPALDYVVVDPGSSDGSRDILARYQGRLTALLDPDKGPADGLNKGFAAAQGEIFGYINADDVLLPGALAAVARRFADPGIDAILGAGVQIDEGGQPVKRIASSRFSRRAFGLGAMTFVQQGHFFRRATFEKAGGFNIANRTSWDWELLIDMALAGARIVTVPDRLGGFRLYPGSITGSGRFAETMARDLARISEKALGRPARASDRLTRLAARAWRLASHPGQTIGRFLLPPPALG